MKDRTIFWCGLRLRIFQRVLFQCEQNKLGRVTDTRDAGVPTGQPTADQHARDAVGVLPGINAACVAREEPLIGREEAVRQPADPPLPAVRVPCENQVERTVFVFRNALGTVRNKNGKRIILCGSAFGECLRRLQLRLVRLFVAQWVFHAAQAEHAARMRQKNGIACQQMHARVGSGALDLLRHARLDLVIAGDVVGGEGGGKYPQRFDRGLLGDPFVKCVAAENDKIGTEGSDGVQQLALSLAVLLGVQV